MKLSILLVLLLGNLNANILKRKGYVRKGETVVFKLQTENAYDMKIIKYKSITDECLSIEKGNAYPGLNSIKALLSFEGYYEIILFNDKSLDNGLSSI